MILTGVLIFLAIIPLHFAKMIFREPYDRPGTPHVLAASLAYVVLSGISLACYAVGILLFWLGLWRLISGGLT